MVTVSGGNWGMMPFGLLAVTTSVGETGRAGEGTRSVVSSTISIPVTRTGAWLEGVFRPTASPSPLPRPST